MSPDRPDLPSPAPAVPPLRSRLAFRLSAATLTMTVASCIPDGKGLIGSPQTSSSPNVSVKVPKSPSPSPPRGGPPQSMPPQIAPPQSMPPQIMAPQLPPQSMPPQPSMPPSLFYTYDATAIVATLVVTGAQSTFRGPTGIDVDVAGNVYLADYESHCIRKLAPNGTMTILAGASGEPGYVDGAGTQARFDGPHDLTVAADGTVYVADFSNHRIRKISPNGLVTTLAGSGKAGHADGPDTTASFELPIAITTDRNGNVYVASRARIRKITPLGVVTTLAGSDIQGTVDGEGSAASFASPIGLAVDAAGTVYVADNATLRKIGTGGTVTTIQLPGGIGVQGVDVDDQGNLYLADRYHHAVHLLTLAGKLITLGGNGTIGKADGPAADARFSHCQDVAVDAVGNVYVADETNNRVAKVSAIATQ